MGIILIKTMKPFFFNLASNLPFSCCSLPVLGLQVHTTKQDAKGIIIILNKKSILSHELFQEV